MAAGFDPALGGGVMYTNPPEVDRELAALRARVADLERAKALCAEQADDIGLWFVSDSASEAYLQAALRDLHAAIEGTGPSAPTAHKPDERLAHGTGPDVLERIAETTQTRLTDQERGHLMDAATLIRTLQKRNEDLANEFLRTGPRQEGGR